MHLCMTALSRSLLPHYSHGKRHCNSNYTSNRFFFLSCAPSSPSSSFSSAATSSFSYGAFTYKRLWRWRTPGRIVSSPVMVSQVCYWDSLLGIFLTHLIPLFYTTVCFSIFSPFGCALLSLCACPLCVCLVPCHECVGAFAAAGTGFFFSLIHRLCLGVRW